MEWKKQEKEIREILETVYDKALEGEDAISDWKKRTLFFNGENLVNIVQSLLTSAYERGLHEGIKSVYDDPKTVVMTMIDKEEKK